MRENNQKLQEYQNYLEQFIKALDTYSDEKIVEEFIQENEKNRVSDPFHIARIMRGNVYQSRNIGNRILQDIRTWDSESQKFFLDSITAELGKLESVFRGYSLVVHEAKLPTFGEGGFYYLVEGSEILITNYKIIEGYFFASQSIFNHLKVSIEKDINPIFNAKNAQVDQLISDLNLYKGEASSRKTKEIYKKKYEDYKRTVEVYELYLMLLVCLSVTLVIGQLFAHAFFDSLNISNAITIKITIVALIATLFAYCYKQIGFYRKISEQAHQTFMELEALPEYLVHLPEDKQHEIRADLAKCYFGQSLFDSIKEDSVSIQEQSKANAEVLKSTVALLEVIKKQSSSPN